MQDTNYTWASLVIDAVQNHQLVLVRLQKKMLD